jgi:hypothetical protein
MPRQDMVKGSSNLATIGALAAPRPVDLRSKSLLRLPSPDQINLVNVGVHSRFPSEQIVRKMRDAERLNCQMNPSPFKHNDTGAQFVSYGTGYFRAWYILNGTVNYVSGMYDTESSALKAAEEAFRSAQ